MREKCASNNPGLQGCHTLVFEAACLEGNCDFVVFVNDKVQIIGSYWDQVHSLRVKPAKHPFSPLGQPPFQSMCVWNKLKIIAYNHLNADVIDQKTTKV